MATHAEQRTVLLAGATGLVGGLMLQALLADHTISAVHALSRRSLNVCHPKLDVRIADAFRKWMPDLAVSERLKATDSEQFHYLDYKAPWSVSNRDGVYLHLFTGQR